MHIDEPYSIVKDFLGEADVLDVDHESTDPARAYAGVASRLNALSQRFVVRRHVLRTVQTKVPFIKHLQMIRTLQ